SLGGLILQLHSFPTRRSSDLFPPPCSMTEGGRSRAGKAWLVLEGRVASHPLPHPRRRKVELVRLTSTTGRSSDLQALGASAAPRSEEHTSELQSRENLVCRLL